MKRATTGNDSVEIRSRKKAKGGKKDEPALSMKDEVAPAAVAPHNAVGEGGKKMAGSVGGFFNSRIWTLIKYGTLLLVLPTFLNFASLAREERELRPRNGTFVRINEFQQMYMKCQGKGRPFVLLDAPTGQTSDVWHALLPRLSKVTEVCAFDRAGLGFSDRTRKSSSEENTRMGPLYTSERMVDDIMKMLQNSKRHMVPLIFVGVGVGAVNAQFFTQMNEKNVAGVVLINPLHNLLFDNPTNNIFNRYWYQAVVSPWQMLHLASAAGLTRLGIQLGLMNVTKQDWPEEIRSRHNYLLCKPGHVSTVVEEHFLVNDSLSQLSTVTKIRQFPKTVPISMVTSEVFDDKAPPQVNKVWETSVNVIRHQFRPVLSHAVVSSNDRDLLWKSSTDVYHSIVEMVNEARVRQRTKEPGSKAI